MNLASSHHPMGSQGPTSFDVKEAYKQGYVAGVAAERERCAKLCDDLETKAIELDWLQTKRDVHTESFETFRADFMKKRGEISLNTFALRDFYDAGAAAERERCAKEKW